MLFTELKEVPVRCKKRYFCVLIINIKIVFFQICTFVQLEALKLSTSGKLYIE